MSEHLHCLDEEHAVSPSAGFMPYGLCEVCLAHPCRSVDEHMFSFFHKQAGGKISNHPALDLRVEGEVEPLEGFLFFKACLLRAGLKLL